MQHFTLQYSLTPLKPVSSCTFIFNFLLVFCSQQSKSHFTTLLHDALAVKIKLKFERNELYRFFTRNLGIKRSTLSVLASVISIFTNTSGGGWWKLFLSLREWLCWISNFFKQFFHHFLVRKWLKYLHNILSINYKVFPVQLKQKNMEE